MSRHDKPSGIWAIFTLLSMSLAGKTTTLVVSTVSLGFSYNDQIEDELFIVMVTFCRFPTTCNIFSFSSVSFFKTAKYYLTAQCRIFMLKVPLNPRLSISVICSKAMSQVPANYSRTSYAIASRASPCYVYAPSSVNVPSASPVRLHGTHWPVDIQCTTNRHTFKTLLKSQFFFQAFVYC